MCYGVLDASGGGSKSLRPQYRVVARQHGNIDRDWSETDCLAGRLGLVCGAWAGWAQAFPGGRCEITVVPGFGQRNTRSVQEQYLPIAYDLGGETSHEGPCVSISFTGGGSIYSVTQ